MQTEEADLSLEERVARLEGKLGWRDRTVGLKPKYTFSALALLLFSLVIALKGLGLPNHYYQVVLAALTIALLYHQQWLALPQKPLEWSLAVLNTAVLSLLFKLFIGGGKRFPLFWIQYPTVQKAAQAEDTKAWTDVVPDLDLSWVPSSAAEYSIDLTIIQTFLLLITLVGALVEFQPFISLTAFLLILVSLPALVSFNWPWVFPALVAAVIALYLQSEAVNED